MLRLNLLLALAWTALTGQFTPVNFSIGFVLGYLALVMTGQSPHAWHYAIRVPKVIVFLGIFLWELIRASLRVAHDVLTPRHRMRPAVVSIPLDVKSDAQITLLANLITLTPGSLALDVAQDRSVLYIHAMYVSDVDQLRRRIKQGFERRILEITA